MVRVLVLATGGTIFQAAGSDGKMQLKLSPAELLAQSSAHLGDLELELLDLQVRSGAELTFETIFRVRDAVRAALDAFDAFLLVTGTDTMDECAFCLALLLDTALARAQKVLAMMGAMKPSDQPGCDGPSNLIEAAKVATDLTTRQALASVVVVMNNDVHLGRYVFKSDSQLIGAFRSHPGPIGQVRSGMPVLYYLPPPPALSLPALDALTAAGLKARVSIWTLTVSAFLPEALLEGLDGLVLAGSGTGSVPAAVLEQLSPRWTARMPIVIVSRCHTGQNWDDAYYQGSRTKYESRGFVLAGGYEHLTPLQARNLLIFRLSSLGHA